jgi:mono/diheme cytochrome c family protein
VITSSVTPPPISGGTLLVRASGEEVVVSDPDHDQLLVVDVAEVAITSTVPLEAGDEPGRLIEDADGRVHAVLRGGAAVATLDVENGSVIERRPVCAYPRGIAYDAALDSLHVACADGYLVTLPAAGGEPTRVVELERDLRDVVVENGRIWVSLFRSAEVLRLDGDGAVVERLRAGDAETFEGTFAPSVGWRLIAAPQGVAPEGGVLMIHQRAKNGEIVIEPGGYAAGGCGGIVAAGATLFAPGEAPQSTPTFAAPLGVDVAVTPLNDAVVVASAAAIQHGQLFTGLPTVGRIGLETLRAEPSVEEGCGFTESALGSLTSSGQAVAVAYAGDKLVVQTRDPWLVIVGDRGVAIPGDSRLDTGHLLFHASTAAGLACASCHPEGREDGQTWNFQTIGPRRTQSIGGVLAATEPFHWGGDEADFTALVQDVMTGRMAGPELQDAHVAALKGYIDAIPPWATPAPADSEAVARGKALFERQDVGCATCHAGPNFTNNESVDVGTGATLQVPSLLGLAFRAPFLHDGCAPTIGDRFSDCGGSNHGDTSALSEAELSDLTTYLESL